MRLIVNVDDAGLHPAVARSVAVLAQLGAVTSTTLMVNGPDARAAAKLVEQGIGVGVHLNILRGRPLGTARQVSTLIGADGLFLGSYSRLLGRYLAGRLALVEVENEWFRQIEQARALGVDPTHLDSEKHLHALPGLLACAARVARRCNIRRLRRPRELPTLRCSVGSVRVWMLQLCALAAGRAPGVFQPDALWGVAAQGRALAASSLLRNLRALGRRGQGVVEVCCHPGLPLAGDPPLTAELGAMRVAAQWADEHAALAAASWRQILSLPGCSGVHYGQL
jgi:predicted glycoside hydrolase/deacetylase ChbG (UPF0249 family)